MGRFQRGDDALRTAQQHERLDDLGIADLLVASPTLLGEVAVLGAHPRVVEAGRDRMGLLDLTELVLQQVAHHAVHDAWHPVAHRGAPGRLDAHQVDLRVLREPREDAGRVGAAAHAGDDHVR